MSKGQTLFTLENRAEELFNYLEGLVGQTEGDVTADRQEVMGMVHALNSAYVAWADEVDMAKVWVVD